MSRKPFSASQLAASSAAKLETSVERGVATFIGASSVALRLVVVLVVLITGAGPPV